MLGFSILSSLRKIYSVVYAHDTIHLSTLQILVYTTRRYVSDGPQTIIVLHVCGFIQRSLNLLILFAGAFYFKLQKFIAIILVKFMLHDTSKYFVI